MLAAALCVAVATGVRALYSHRPSSNPEPTPGQPPIATHPPHKHPGGQSVLEPAERFDREAGRFAEGVLKQGLTPTSDVVAYYDRSRSVSREHEFVHDLLQATICSFPDLAMSTYGQLLKDPAAGWPAKLAAIDRLGVLGRARNPGAASILRETLASCDADTAPGTEWVARAATTVLGRYYDDADTVRLLTARALRGCETACSALAYFPETNVRALEAQRTLPQSCTEAATERIEILRDPQARTLLRGIIRGELSLKSSSPEDAADWAIECAARARYEDSVEAIRAYAEPRKRTRKVGDNLPPDLWVTRNSDNPELKHALRALARLGTLTAAERTFVQFEMLDGSADSAGVAAQMKASRTDGQAFLPLVDLRRKIR